MPESLTCLKVAGIKPGDSLVHFQLHHGLFGQAKNTYPSQLYPKKMISKSKAQMPMNMDDQSSKKPIAILKRNFREDEDVQFSI